MGMVMTPLELSMSLAPACGTTAPPQPAAVPVVSAGTTAGRTAVLVVPASRIQY